jgi:hypothetical protein
MFCIMSRENESCPAGTGVRGGIGRRCGLTRIKIELPFNHIQADSFGRTLNVPRSWQQRRFDAKLR